MNLKELYGVTPLKLEKLEGLKFAHIKTKEELNELEQVNIQEGIEWLKRTKDVDVFSEKFIRNLHKQLLGKVWGWAGTYRSTEKGIDIDPLYISVEVKKLLDDAKYWYQNSTYSPKESATRFHHRLVLIHPFSNENGRHSRIATDAILIKAYHLPAIDWSAGCNLQEMNMRRKEYILALKKADKGNFNLLFKFTNC